MNSVNEMFVRGVFFFTLGVILASLFMWSMVNGVATHLGGDFSSAFAYYFVGWISGVAALALYWQAKHLFHFAEISK